MERATTGSRSSWALPATALAGAACGALLAAGLLERRERRRRAAVGGGKKAQLDVCACASAAAGGSAAATAAGAVAWEQAPGSPFPLGFHGRRALVTGAGSGIGRAIAERLAQHGAEVVAVDRDAKALEALREELPEKVTPFTCDLQDLDALKQTVEQVGSVDFLVNVAGVAIFQQFFDGTPEVWDKTMDINARATWFLCQQLAKGMLTRGGGSIVNMSSQSSSVVVSDRHLAYSTSKAAVDHITRSAAVALAKHNVRVNAVNPTVVRTELAVNAHGEDGLARMAAKVPLGKICMPNDVADTVLFLLSDRAAMITGVTLPVDGGFLAARI